MSTVTILGAGAMGSALATPAVAAGNRVRLWGIRLDGGSWPSCGPAAPTRAPASRSTPGWSCTTPTSWPRPWTAATWSRS
jgi:hypothetical protein